MTLTPRGLARLPALVVCLAWYCTTCASRQQIVSPGIQPGVPTWQVETRAGEIVCVFTQRPGYVFIGAPSANVSRDPGAPGYLAKHSFLTIMFPTEKHFRWVWPTLERATTAQQVVFSLRSQGFNVSEVRVRNAPPE
jgi:hypothetical protein